MAITLVGAACDLGVSKDGASKGAEAIINDLSNDINKIIIKQDQNFVKSTDKNDKAKNLDEVNKFNKYMYEKELELKNNDSFVISVGGDHVMGIPPVLSSVKKYGEIGLIWVDAHPDFNTFETTITGNLHGLPCAAVAGYHCDKLTEFHDGNYVNPKNIVIVGARSIDEGEMVNLKDAGVTIISAEEVRKMGVKNVMDKAYKIALQNTGKLHISFDLDVIDPNDAPGVTVPEKDGILEDEAYEIINYITDRYNVLTSLDVVEYNPVYDLGGKTKKIAVNLVNNAIEKRLKYERDNEKHIK